jgi:hypothetical protein
MEVTATLGEDLLLLSIRPDQGSIATLHQIDYGLMGAELARRAASGRIDIADNRIVVQDSAATGDAELDAAVQAAIAASAAAASNASAG